MDDEKKALKKALEEALLLIQNLKKEIAELREQLNNNSNNSSLPPSQDMKKKPKKRAPRNNKGRSHGGQPGHKGKTRPLAPPEALSAVVECKPIEQCECGGTVRLNKNPALHQVYDIPAPVFEITEYQIYRGCCEDCGNRHRDILPQGVSHNGYGSRMHALVSLLTSKYRMSKRQVQDWFKDIYQMPVSAQEQSIPSSLR